jgi:hypothetical protein
MAACTGKGKRLAPLPLGLQTRAAGARNSAIMSGEALCVWRAGSAFVVGINLLSRILAVAEGSVDSLTSYGPAKPRAAEETLISRVTATPG